MITGVLAIANLTCLLLFSGVVLENKNILKVATLSLVLFYVEYLAVSAFFLYTDMFYVLWCLYTQTVINVVLLIAVFPKVKKSLLLLKFEWKEITTVACLLGIVLFCCNAKTERFLTGADEGIYLEKAIALLSNSTSHICTLNEYGKISEAVNLGLIELQKSQPGLNTTYISDQILQYEYHALPLWPAFIALFMDVFGIFKGTLALNFVFIVAILTGYFCVEKTAAYQNSKYLVFPLFAFLPLSIYLAKVTLAVMAFVAMLFSGYFFLQDKRLRAFSFLPLGLLGFLHISTVMYLPFIAILLFAASLLKKDVSYGIANIGISSLYIFSLSYDYKVSGIYSSDIFSGNLGNENLAYIVAVCFSLLVIGQFGVFLIRNRIDGLNKVIGEICERGYRIFFVIVVVFIVAFTVYQGYLLGFTERYINAGENMTSWVYRSSYANQGIVSLSRLNIVSIFMATGYLSIPYIIYRLFSKKDKWDYLDMGLMVLFLESLAIYTVARCDIPFNYYASRYFMMMIVPSSLFLSTKLIRTKKEFTILSTVAGITSLPFMIALIPMICFGGTVETYNDIAQSVGKDSVVLIDKDDPFLKLQVNNLRQINGNLVYEMDNFEEVTEFYEGRDCYVVSSNGTKQDKNVVKKLSHTPVLKNEYRIYGDIMRLGAIYPLTQTYEDIEISIYKVLEEQLVYDFGGNENFDVENFNNNEGEFRWTTEESSMTAILDGSYSYKMTLQLKDILPLDKLERDTLKFSICFNGMKAGTFEIKKNEPQTAFTLYVDKKFLEKGLSENKVTILSEVWQPSEYGSSDQRYLGIPVDKITFEKVEESK